MVCFQQFQFGNLNIQIHLFLNIWVSGSKCFYLCIRQGGFINILTGTNRGFTGHDLAYELLLVFNDLPGVTVKGSFCHIAENLYFWILVALAQDSSFLLFNIGRSPGHIQMVQGNQLILDVGSGSHLGGRTQQK